MTIPIANYREPHELFRRLWQPACDHRILLWQGESGCGKTTLVNHCLREVPDHVVHVPIDLRSRAVTVAEIFHHIVRIVGDESLPQFARRVAALGGAPEVKIDRNWLAGINNRITVVLQVENPQEQAERRAALTDALFDDLKQRTEPILFVLDTYEKATSSVVEWMNGAFLTQVPWVHSVRVLIAGQQVPDHNNIVWQRCCAHRQLLGVPEAKDWLPVVQALQRNIPFGEPLTWLAGVCHALKGRPHEIRQIIEGLPPLPAPEVTG